MSMGGLTIKQTRIMPRAYEQKEVCKDQVKMGLVLPFNC
jgi:hypothetical protein